MYSSEKRRHKIYYGYVVVATAFAIQVLGFGLYSSFGIFFNSLLNEFGWSRAMISGAASLFAFMMGISSMITGVLNDRFGPRILMTLCGIFWGLGYILMSQTQAVWQLYLFYGVVVGIGISHIDVLPLTTIARWFIRKRGMMSGIAKAGAGVGILILPLLVTWLISSYGWRNSFIIIGIGALVITLVLASFLRRDPSKMGMKPYGEDNTGLQIMNSRSKTFSLNRAIHTRQFWLLCLIYILIIFCGDAILVHIVPHAIDLGIVPTNAAGILAVIGGVSIIGRFTMGAAGDRMGNKWVMIICFTILAVTFLMLLVANDLRLLYLFAVIYGIAHGGLFTLMSPWIAELFGLNAHGAIFGTVGFIGTTGGALGPVLFGQIFDVTRSYQLAFIVCITISVVAIILSFFVKPFQVEEIKL